MIYIYIHSTIYIYTYIHTYIFGVACLSWSPVCSISLRTVYMICIIYMCVIHQDFWLHEIEDARRVLGPLRRGKSRLLKKVQAKGGAYFSRL